MPTAEIKPDRFRAVMNEMRSRARPLSLALTLFLFWLMLSGYFTAFLVAAGLGCAVATALIADRLALVDDEGHPVQISLRAMLGYWPWLFKEIVKSALQVSWVVLNPKLPIEPRLVRFKPSQTSDLGIVIHANSITLTPGTLCIEADGDEFLVHALTAASAAGVGTQSEMDQRVARLEQMR